MSLRFPLVLVGTLLLSSGCGDVPSKIPSDITYTVINETKLPRIKRSVDIRLNRPVSEATLTTIAAEIKSSDSGDYERTFIGYYLPEMQVGAGCWATSHYNPDLDVQILGLSADAAATPK